MFGYVTFNKEELKLKDYELYRSFYCGLCRELRERYGVPGMITVTYDMTFVIMLLTSLYEPGVHRGKTRCIIRPVRPHQVRKSRFTEYAADMNMILAYYKSKDDWEDEKSPLGLAGEKAFHGAIKRLEKTERRKLYNIETLLKELSELEKDQVQDLDAAAGISGRLLEQVLVWREDEWAPTLKRLGFYLGKFIYLMDAFDDLEKDEKSGNYNPLMKEYKKKGYSPEFVSEVRQLLTMMLSEVCMEFERLPVIAYADILRNILYSGIWTGFERADRRRKNQTRGKKEYV